MHRHDTDTDSLSSSNVRHKIVVMGAARTGKTSLITQFLYSRFSPKYKRTVEEMHQGAFSISGVNLTLDILDTSGANEVNKLTFVGYEIRQTLVKFLRMLCIIQEKDTKAFLKAV